MQTLQRSTEPSTTPSKAEIFCIQAENIGKWWPTVLKFLNVFENPDWTTDEVFEAVKDKHAQVWGVVNHGEIIGIWITKVLTTKRLKYGLVWIISGTGLEIGMPLYLQHCETWFKDLGCAYIELQGRKGWQKVLSDYEFNSVILRKLL